MKYPFYPSDASNFLIAVRWKWTTVIKGKLQVTRYQKKRVCVFLKKKKQTSGRLIIFLKIN